MADYNRVYLYAYIVHILCLLNYYKFHICFLGFSDCPGLGLMVYQCFHSLIDSHIATHYKDIVTLLLKKGRTKVETVSEKHKNAQSLQTLSTIIILSSLNYSIFKIMLIS